MEYEVEYRSVEVVEWGPPTPPPPPPEPPPDGVLTKILKTVFWMVGAYVLIVIIGLMMGQAQNSRPPQTPVVGYPH